MWTHVACHCAESSPRSALELGPQNGDRHPGPSRGVFFKPIGFSLSALQALVCATYRARSRH
jgi:hypothetical protein